MKKVAVITGANGGLGAEICNLLLSQAYSVVGLDLNWTDNTKFDFQNWQSIEIDLSIAENVQQTFEDIRYRYGGIDVLVNNAGTCLMSDFDEITSDELIKQIEVNFYSCFYCCQAAIPLMIDRPGIRKIINISSNGAYNFDVFDPPHYRASKAAMDTLTKDLARRYAKQKITVNSIAPAMTQTPLFDVLDENTLSNAIAAMPHGTAMQPSQVAEWVCFLSGKGGDVCSGNIIILNQGRDVR